MKKILVIQTASIGDVVLVTSLLETLNFSMPDASIDVLVKSGNHSLFESHPFINKVVVWNKSNKKYKNLLMVIAMVRVENYDLVINVQRFFSSGLITALSGGRKMHGFSKNPLSIFYSKRFKHRISKTEFTHETDRNFQLIKSLVDVDKPLMPKLYPSKNIEAKMSEFKRGIYYTVSPSSLWPTKAFHKQGWIDFLKEVDKDSIIYLLGSKSDYDLCQEIKTSINHPNTMNLSGKLSFLESCSLMREAKMNFTNDSAPLHFASAVNAPVTAIFTSTLPEYGFTPLSDDSLIVETKKPLSCKPCGLHGKRECPKGHFDCSITIDIQDLVDRL